MLINAPDLPISGDEWSDFLREQEFGQVITSGRDRSTPVVPAHYWYDGVATVELHLHKKNPIWSAFAENARAMLAVIDAYLYIPSYWNAAPDEAVEWAAPTSYYAAV